MIFVIFGGPLAVFGLFCIKAYYKSREILSLLRRVDPQKARQLSPVTTPFLREIIWMDPIAFKRFVKSDDWKGRGILETMVREYVQIESRIRVVWFFAMCGGVVTGLWFFLAV
jgi:hypothetical protein